MHTIDFKKEILQYIRIESIVNTIEKNQIDPELIYLKSPEL